MLIHIKFYLQNKNLVVRILKTSFFTDFYREDTILALKQILHLNCEFKLETIREPLPPNQLS